MLRLVKAYTVRLNALMILSGRRQAIKQIWFVLDAGRLFMLYLCGLKQEGLSIAVARVGTKTECVSGTLSTLTVLRIDEDQTGARKSAKRESAMAVRVRYVGAQGKTYTTLSRIVCFLIMLKLTR